MGSQYKIVFICLDQTELFICISGIRLTSNGEMEILVNNESEGYAATDLPTDSRILTNCFKT